jgi:hypothetical protein
VSGTVWIGGGTGGGKSTLARALATRHGLRRFALDSFWYAYVGDRPRKDPDEQWLRTTPEMQADEFEEVSRVMHELALRDIAGSPMPTVVEGPQVQPDLIPRGDTAVFLDPTPAWQREVLSPRPMPTSDPAQALANRLVKDRIYGDRIAARARELGFAVLVNNGSRPLVGDAEARLDIPHGPIDLRAARRWENEMGAAHIRARLSSPEAPSFEPSFPFSCECGEPGCDATIRLTLAEFDAGAVRSAH